MNKYVLAILAIFAVPSMASAQQVQPDTDFMSKALNALQGQRNQALDNQAALEAKLAQTTDQLNKAKDKIKELEDKMNAQNNNKNPGEESKKK